VKTHLSTTDMLLVEDLFQGARGYVLDFSNATMADFFARDLGVDIYANAYAKNGTSKFNRLRCYLQEIDRKAAARALTGSPRTAAQRGIDPKCAGEAS
jgi:hypothetical protein